jgi:hypothetical protein
VLAVNADVPDDFAGVIVDRTATLPHTKAPDDLPSLSHTIPS